MAGEGKEFATLMSRPRANSREAVLRAKKADFPRKTPHRMMRRLSWKWKAGRRLSPSVVYSLVP